MPTFESVRASYRALWAGMVISPAKVAAADAAAKRILAGKERYRTVQIRTTVPWVFIGLCHLREGNLNFGTYLGNGQSIAKVTDIVPIGRGPFKSFEDGAVDALGKQELLHVTDWSLERMAYCLEGFNGYGYRSHGVNSPYLWAGTNRYTKGKFTRDHYFDPEFVDTQLGSMAVLARLCALDSDVAALVNGVAPKLAAPTPAPQPIPDVPPVVKPAPQQPGWLGALISAIAAMFKKG